MSVEGICGLLIWAVLLVITQPSPKGSSVTCEVGKAHSHCYFLSKPPRAFGTPGRSDPKTDGVQGKFSSQEKIPAEEIPQLHFLQLGFVASSDTTGEHQGRTGLSILETVLFHLLSLLYIFSIGEELERKICCPKLCFLCLFVSLWGKRDFFDLWGAVGTLSQHSTNYTPEFVFKFCFLLWPNALCCSHTRTSACLTREAGTMTLCIHCLLPRQFPTHHWLQLWWDFGIHNALNCNTFSRGSFLALNQLRDSCSTIHW